MQAAIADQEVKSIKKVVYDSYQPRHYIRRGSRGGLLDRDNIFGELTDGWGDGFSELSVFNRTPPNEYYYHGALTSPYIDEAVEYSREYDYYTPPGDRGFTKDAIEQLEKNKNHEKALKGGLQKQKIDCETK